MRVVFVYIYLIVSICFKKVSKQKLLTNRVQKYCFFIIYTQTIFEKNITKSNFFLFYSKKSSIFANKIGNSDGLRPIDDR